MNVNLHIDSIVLDGIDLAPGESQLLQVSVVNELTTILKQQVGGYSISNVEDQSHHSDTSIKIGQTVNATALGAQLASAINTSISPSQTKSCLLGGANS